MKANRYSRGGYTLVEIMIVVAIIGMLAAIAIPNFVKARNNSHRSACINNLRQLDSATQQWALEAGKQDTDSTAANVQDIYNYLKVRALPVCPAGGTVAVGPRVADAPTCSLNALGHVLP